MATEVLVKWFTTRVSFTMIAADVFFFALGILIAMYLGTKKTPLYLMLSMAIVYAVCSIMTVTSEDYIVVFPVFFGALAALLFAGNLVGFIIRLATKLDEKKAAKKAGAEKKKSKNGGNKNGRT